MSFSLANRCVRGTGCILTRSLVVLPHRLTVFVSRKLSNESEKGSELSSSTLLVQDGHNVQELPVIVRKIKDVVVLCQNNWVPDEKNDSTQPEVNNYPIIREEFEQCLILKDVFSLLSKCTKITPNIALAAVERIYEIENGNLSTPFGEKVKEINANMAKGAIIDKLMNVLLKTEDTQTLLNALWAVSNIVEQHRYKFIDELLMRVSDDKLSIEQLCEFVSFFEKNKSDPYLADAADKLWTGFTARELDIDEKNLSLVYKTVALLKSSKKLLFNLLEKKLLVYWWKLKAPEMQEIIDILWKERNTSYRALQVVGRWTNTNIHILDEDVILNVISKMTSLKYTDNQLERAIERYVKVKGINIKSHALMVTILNYCIEFRLRNNHILNGCSEYFAAKGSNIPSIFLKSFIFPFGYLNFQPSNGIAFWRTVEVVLEEKFTKLQINDILDIMLSCIYLEKYPLNFIDKVFNPQFLSKLNIAENPELLRMKLKLIDTAMSLECKLYNGPKLPKDHFAKSVNHDSRTWRLVNSIRDTIEKIAGGPDKFTPGVVIPYLYTNELYIIDVMLHPAGLGNSILNLKLKSDHNVNVALLIHLPEHYCYGSDLLVGPQLMRRKHLRLLGLKVVDLNYKTISKYKMHRNQLEKYLIEQLKSAKPSL